MLWTVLQRRLPSMGMIIFSWLLIGCGKSSGPELVEVTGTVTLDGKPLSNAVIYFLPNLDKGTKGPTASAVLDAEGKYRLSSPGGKSGVIKGHHFVTLICQENGVREVEPNVFVRIEGKCLLPARYSYEKTSKLVAEVAKSDTIDFELTTKP